MVTNSQRYRDKVSQMISWGHWFALFNILLSLGIGSCYLFITDWPGSLAGRLYAFASWLGHFSFLGFTLYLLVVFPLTFVVISQRLLRFLSAIITTAGLMLLLLDTEIFTRFHLHLNPMIWKLVINTDQTELARDWQLIFIGIPVIFIVEMLFSTWSWQKLYSLNRYRYRIGKPISAIFISAFCASHVAYIWADANFYRPITMQRTNLPQSYPMTARHFLERHGLLNAQYFERRLVQQNNPEAAAVEYPLSLISFNDNGSSFNLLIITTDILRNDTLDQQMPALNRFAQQNIRFMKHFSTGNQVDTGLFGLFYGISASYLDVILATRKSSVLLEALNKQGYQLSLFPSDGFRDPLYRQALLADFTLPKPINQSDAQTTRQWQQWRESYRGTSPWFSYVSFNGTSISLANTLDITRCYQQEVQRLDNNLAQMLDTLRDHGDLDNTVVIITAATGLEWNDDSRMRRESSTSFNRAQLQVPLVIHWPGIPAQVVTKLTNHNDVTVTLMQRLLHVSNRANDYAHGEALFIPRRRNDWVLSADRHQLAIITSNKTLLLDNNGSYRIFDVNGKELPQQKSQLTLLLQVLTNEKRFIAN